MKLVRTFLSPAHIKMSIDHEQMRNNYTLVKAFQKLFRVSESVKGVFFRKMSSLTEYRVLNYIEKNSLVVTAENVYHIRSSFLNDF